jgi:hypothetical protein
MPLTRNVISLAVVFLAGFGPLARSDEPRQQVKETVIAGPNQVALKVRMEGPYTADVPLQVVCYFRFTKDGAKRMSGAPVELDKHLGGVIAALRERGEFVGDELETCLILPKERSIEARALLLVGLGDEAKLSLDTMERVGKVALREAVRLGVPRVAFAPLIRDQGNTAFPTGEVARAVVRGMLLADDTERRLQKEKLAKAYTLEEWWVEAGPAYFDETVAGVRKASAEAIDLIKARGSKPYTAEKR